MRNNQIAGLHFGWDYFKRVWRSSLELLDFGFSQHLTKISKRSMKFHSSGRFGLLVGLLLAATEVMGKIKMIDSVCSDFNRSYLSNVSLVVRNSRVYFDTFLLRGLDTGVTMDLEFRIGVPKSREYKRIFQYSLDMCSILALKKSSMFKRWFSTFFEAGNFPRYCPVHPNHYYLKDYNYNTLFIPTFLYAGQYKVTFNMTQYRDKRKTRDFVVACAFYAEIK
ncbi:uncharacterized protein [Drosophila pseudoobscura]|uniref:Uncharacterized protein n=1 Tax=Drosophila pseudoobscura pseudoobscura TaxID=46245 RepID=A0A6I8V228_DROPS|nr:uncharacterized protein LOC6899906 [Drosophila pseudoobscura]